MKSDRSILNRLRCDANSPASGMTEAEIQAASQAVLSGNAPMYASAPVGEIIEAADSQGRKLKTFSMEAYTGKPLRQWWSSKEIVVDISALDQLPDGTVRIFRDHSPSRIVGHTTSVQMGNNIQLSGVISGAGADASEIIESAANGFPWQASIGVNITATEDIPAGESVTVNGQTFQGPLLVVRGGTRVETSFVALGADNETEASVAASRSTKRKESGMNPEFVKWLKAQGYSAEAIAQLEQDEPARVKAESDWKASLEAGGAPDPKTPPNPPSQPIIDLDASINGDTVDRVGTFA